MANREDRIENRIKEGLYREAEDIRKEIGETGEQEIPEELREDLWLKLQEKIDAHEEKKLYTELSEKDREALRLGREIQDGMKEDRELYRKPYGKRRRRIYVILAAAMVLVLAIGMTSMGGAERMASVMRKFVGEREVVKVNSDKENITVENENEQKAYEEIKDAFGVDPVKIIKRQENWGFLQMNLDEKLQVAELTYQYGSENFWYIVSAGYYGSSFGFDIEDEVVKKEDIEVDGHPVEITTYRIKESGKEKCSAHFTHNELEYFLTATVEEKQFKDILKNLYFL